MSSKRRKPAIAFNNQDRGQSNLLKKITLLEECSIEIQKSEFSKTNMCNFPSSVRQFNLWDSIKGPFFLTSKEAEVVRNSNETLRRYPLFKAKVESLLSALKAAQSAHKEKDRPSLEKSFRRQLGESEKMRLTLERELIIALKTQEQITSERNMLLDKIAVLQRNLHEFSRKPHLASVRSAKRAPRQR
jgi:hypothetical protein